MREKTYKTALGGVMAALALALMSLGSLIPFGTFAVPAASSICIMIIDEELHDKTALLTYLSVSVLSMLIAADKEAALIFIGIAGYYPIVKRAIEARLSKAVGTILKFVLFNSAIFLIYFVVYRFFFPAAFSDELAAYSLWMIIVLVLMGNLVFGLLDVLLDRMKIIYRCSWRQKFIRSK